MSPAASSSWTEPDRPGPGPRRHRIVSGVTPVRAGPTALGVADITGSVASTTAPLANILPTVLRLGWLRWSLGLMARGVDWM